MADRNSVWIGRTRPHVWAVVAMVSGAAMLSAGVFTTRIRSDVPHGMAVQEAPRPEMQELRARTVHTVTIGPDGSEMPAKAENAQVIVQGRAIAQADIDRARANLEQGLRALRANPAGDFDAARWTGSVAGKPESRDAPRDDEPGTAQAAPPQQAESAKPPEPEPAVGAREGVPAGLRVTIHWPKQDGTSAKLAKDLARSFKENGWTVAALQPVAASVFRAEVRHPGAKEADRVKSELANWLVAEGYSDRIVVSRRKTAGNVAEIWLPRSSNLGRAPVRKHQAKLKPKKEE